MVVVRFLVWLRVGSGKFSDEWEKLPMLAVLALQVPVPVRFVLGLLPFFLLRRLVGRVYL